MELILEIPQAQQDTAWLESQAYPNSIRFQVYVNKLSLLGVAPWLEEVTTTKISSVNNCWELVNGTVITIGQTRLVLIPSQTIDTNQFRVPIEWVDINSWAAEYYLAIQVNCDDGFVRIWVYTTHLELKTKATYNGRNHTYSLEYEDLTHDITTLWVSRELCPEIPTLGEIKPLPTLSTDSANDFISRLANPAIAFPRRAVPFTVWGALLSNDEYRQRLIESRKQP